MDRAALGYFITPCVGTLITLLCYILLPRLVSPPRRTTFPSIPWRCRDSSRGLSHARLLLSVAGVCPVLL